MYNTTADDLARIANDLDQIAKKYTDGSQQLDQHVTSLDNATSYLLSGGPEQWVGLSSDAFHSAYLERRARMQQASQILSQSAQHLTQFVQAIENNLPTIRADQSLMQGQTRHMLAPDDQASILNEESQAQNAIITALAALNSQLDALAEEVRDCPEELNDSIPIWSDPSGANHNSNDPNPPGGNNNGAGSGEQSGQDAPQEQNVPPYVETAAQYAEDHQGAAQPGYVGDRPYANDGRGGTEVLPRTTADGNPITYREYDVHSYTPGVNRGTERAVIGSDGRRWYTGDHYRTFTQF